MYIKNRIPHLVILLCLISFNSNAKITIIKKNHDINITIFIHGTHTRPLTNIFSKYIKLPNKLNLISELEDCFFYKSLMKSLIKSNQHEFPIDSFYIFGWSGELSNNARFEAAQTLYKCINQLIEKLNEKNLKYRLTIVGHSHGGNVALNLANVCRTMNNNFDFNIDRLVLLGSPVQEETKHLVKNSIFKQVYNIYSSMDTFQLIDLQFFHPENKNKNVPFFSQRKFDSSPNLKQTKIKINDRALFHLEFILEPFLTSLPQLLNEIDKIKDDKTDYLIKINLKKNHFEIYQSGKKYKEQSVDKKIENKEFTIFVHGSHTTTKLFIKYMDQINKLINVRDLNESHHSYFIAKNYCRTKEEFNSFYAFGWPGRMNSQCRYEAAKILYKEIKNLFNQFKEQPKLTIITHSHGGNVLLNFARLAKENNLDFTIDKLILLACPVQEETKNFIKHPIFKNIYNIYSALDTFQILDMQRFHEVNKDKKVPLFSQRKFDPHPKLKQGKIKINNRALFHVEFILEKFLQTLPDIVSAMDKNNIKQDLIKIDTNN